MTKKDYELLAKAVKESIEFYDRDNASQSQDELSRARTAIKFYAKHFLVPALEKENSRFNEVKFLETCGI